MGPAFFTRLFPLSAFESILFCLEWLIKWREGEEEVGLRTKVSHGLDLAVLPGFRYLGSHQRFLPRQAVCGSGGWEAPDAA